MFEKSYVIGCGSIGYKHAKELLEFSRKIRIVDPIKNKGIEELILNNPDRVSFSNSIEEGIEHLGTDDLVVVSNWGPSHFETAEKMIHLDVRNLIIEKPAFVSLNEISEFMSIVPNNCKVLVNQANSWNREGEKIREIGLNLGLGEIQSVGVLAGAKCLSTSGSHVIHFVSELFRSEPIKVIGLGNSERINPRSKHLDYVEGVFGFSFPEFKSLSISYSNNSSIDSPLELLWRDAIGKYQQGRLVIEKRESEDKTSKITQYGIANKVVYNGNLEESDSSPNHFQEIYKAISTIDIEKSRADLKKHLNSNTWMLKAILSMELGHVISAGQILSSTSMNKKYAVS